MSWVNINANANNEDMPRLLKKKEIDFITSHIPYSFSADKSASILCRQEIVDWAKKSLNEVEICPSAISELIDMMLDYHYDSLVEPGTALISVAEALGSTLSQATLNSFHASGQVKSASIGIEYMKDLIFARKNPKNEVSKIYYEKLETVDKTGRIYERPLTYEEVLNSRKYICGAYIEDFIEDYEIIDRATAPFFWWHKIINELREPKEIESIKMMRLHLNIAEMYKHGVTIQDIVMKIEENSSTQKAEKNGKRGKKDKIKEKMIVAAFSPNSIGIIDIYPTKKATEFYLADPKMLQKEQIHIMPRELAEEIYLENFIYPDFKNILVKGIEGIFDLNPVVQPIWSIVHKEKKLKGSEWELFYNFNVIKKTGITKDNLATLCINAGFIIEEMPKNKGDISLKIIMPKDRFRTSKNNIVIYDDKTKEYYGYINPSNIHYNSKKFIRVLENGISWKQTVGGYEEYVDDDNYIFHSDSLLEKLPNGYFLRKIEKDDFMEENGGFYEKLLVPMVSVRELHPSEYVFYKIREEKEKDQNSDLVLSSQYVYAEVNGANLKELFQLPQIDKTRTNCNNMHIITHTLGIESARTFIIKALHATINNYASYVHPTNITFIAEFICSRGQPFGTTYTGISRQKGGHLSLATIERAGKVFAESAIYGKKEDIRNVSASIVVGARVAIGDGSFDIAQDVSFADGSKKTIINNDLFSLYEEADDEYEHLETLEELKKNGFFDLRSDYNTIEVTTGEKTGILNLFPEEEPETCKLDNPIQKLIDGPIPLDKEDAFQHIVFGIPQNKESLVEKVPEEVTEIMSNAINFMEDPPVMTVISSEDEKLQKEIENVFACFHSEEIPKEIEVEFESPMIDLPPMEYFDPDSKSAQKQREATKRTKKVEFIDINKLTNALHETEK